MLAFHTASTAVMAAAQERGKLAVADHCDMGSVAPDAQVLAVTHPVANSGQGDTLSRSQRHVEATMVDRSTARVALIAGASGLVGRELLAQLLADARYREIHVLGRRALPIT
ncbi:MAG: hypothetical protein WCH44_14605, partial [Betaproteobacteria bacterium]